MTGRFLRFGLVGASGVAVNALVLAALVELAGWPVLLASLVSIEAAMLSNWALNRRFTWSDRSNGWSSLGRYHAVAAIGMAVQWLVLAAAVAWMPVHYLVGSLLGVAAGTMFNFVGNERFAFRRHDAKPLPRWALYAISGGLQLIIAALLMHPWDTFVFQRSVEDFLLRGQTPYEVAAAAPAYTYWGGALPAMPLWYAYPPLPLLLMVASDFPHALGWIGSAWVGRVLIRLPFIAATLGFAWAAHKLVATAPGQSEPAAQRRARNAERWILLNPLFIVIAGLWGQFEALVLLLLTLGILVMRKQQWARSGLLWGLAVCVKIFPLYLAPLYAIHLARRGGRKAVTRFATAAAAVGLAINLPFFLASPSGFLQQVLWMHSQRPPARLAPLAYVSKFLEFLSRSFPGVLPEAAVWDRWLGPVSFLLTATLIAALAAASRRKPADEARLIEWSAWTLLGGLMVTKVLNEQYLLLPFGLLAIAHLHPQRTPGRGHAVLVWGGSIAVAAAGLLAGFNLLYAFPPALAKAVLGGPAPEVIGGFAESIGLLPSQLRSILAWTTGLGLLIPGLVAVRELAGPVRIGLVAIERRLFSGLRQTPVGHHPVATMVSLALLCATPLGVALMTGGHAVDGGPIGSDGRYVLADYTTSWYNPAPDGASPGGSWDGVAERPLAGYYNLNSHKVQVDLAQMRAAGLDGVVIQVHPFYNRAAGLAVRAAELADYPSALGLDVSDLGDHAPALDADGVREVRWLLLDAVPGHAAAAHALRGPNGGRLVFLSGVADVQPRFTAGEHAYALESLLGADVDASTLHLARQSPPRSAADLAKDDAVAALWRQAYAAALPRWWAQALDVPGLDLLSDAPVPGAPAHVVGSRAAAQPAAFDAPAEMRVTSVDLLEPNSVRAAFAHAFWTEAPGVLVPWNDFRHGRAAEPTVRFGDATLAELKAWTTAFHTGVLPSDALESSETPPSTIDRVTDELPPWAPEPRDSYIEAVRFE